MADITPNAIVELLAGDSVNGRKFPAGSRHRVLRVAGGTAYLADDCGRVTVPECPIERLKRLSP